MLHRLILPPEAGDAETLINGSLVVLSADAFKTITCAVVAKREAARALGGDPYQPRSRYYSHSP